MRTSPGRPRSTRRGWPPLPLLPGVPQAPGAAENHQHHRHDCRCPRYLPLFIFTQSLRFQPGTGWCDSVCRCLQRVVTISSKARRALRESQKVYYEFSEDGLIQSDGQKPVFYPWKDIRILYQVGDDFQGVAFGTTAGTLSSPIILSARPRSWSEIVAHVKDHAQIDSRIFEHINLPEEEEASPVN